MTRFLACCLIGAATLAQQPPVPPLPSAPVSITRFTNGSKVIELRVSDQPVPKVDMPQALPVSESAPHFYYGVAEFRRTKKGLETENEVFSFGKFNNDELFMQSQSVGNPVFDRRYKAVFKSASQLPSNIECIWQRRDGFAP